MKKASLAPKIESWLSIWNSGYSFSCCKYGPKTYKESEWKGILTSPTASSNSNIHIYELLSSL
jgi:hypothetical protein